MKEVQKSKKFITAVLATIMVMSTAACGGNASQNSSSQQSAGVSSATSATGEEKTGYDTHVELSRWANRHPAHTNSCGTR